VKESDRQKYNRLVNGWKFDSNPGNDHSALNHGVVQSANLEMASEIQAFGFVAK